MTRRVQILGWVNRQRALYGAGPLKDLRGGEPRNSVSCPIANSLKVGDRYEAAISPAAFSVWNPWGDAQIPRTATPKFVAAAIRQYDEHGTGPLAPPSRRDK